MRLPRVRFTVRTMMVVTATLAVSWCMLPGIGELAAYAEHARLERYFREGAAKWEAKEEAGHAATWRGSAELQASLKRQSLSRGLPTLGLIGLGSILGGIGLAVRARYGPASSGRTGRINGLAAVCSVGAKTIFASLIIAGITYSGMLLLLMASDD